MQIVFQKIKFVRSVRIVCKTSIGIVAIATLFGCLTTQEFHKANEMNQLDNRLTAHIIEANQADDRTPKREIEIIALQAHDAGDAMLAEKQYSLALGFYRIAALAYWRDDVAENNDALFVVTQQGSRVCSELKKTNSAPDRDCFLMVFTPLLAAVESEINLASMNPSSPLAPRSAADMRTALSSFTNRQSEAIAASNGTLVNLMLQAQAREAFLFAHESINRYVCANIFGLLDQHYTHVSILNAYFARQSVAQDISAEQPIYQAIANTPVNASDVNARYSRLQTYLNTQLKPCSAVPLTVLKETLPPG